MSNEFKEAVEKLEAEYEKALKNKLVMKPIAYSLYRVWLEYDKQEERKPDVLQKVFSKDEMR